MRVLLQNSEIRFVAISTILKILLILLKKN